MKNTIIKKTIGSLLSLTIIVLSSQGIRAQLKVGNNPTTINASSMIEIESTNKGMLLPRIALSATNTPTLAGGSHVAGMAIYNTATAGSGVTAVTPGYYYNDGAQWVRLAAGGNGGNVSLPVTNLVSNNSPAGNTVGQLLYNTNPNIGLPVGPVYWDGTTWVAINPAASANLYNSDGTLTGARTLTQGANALTFDGAGNFIKMGGNVGIGTATPTANLHVIGTVKLGGTATTSGYIEFERTGQAFRDGYLGYGNNGGIDFVSEVAFKPLNLSTNSGNIILGPGTGNVGISTSTPTAKLDVAGNARIQTLPAGIATDEVVTTDASGNLRKLPASNFTGATGPQGPAGPQGATGPAGSNATADGDAWGVTGEDQASAIFRGGNVGIGTASPTANLHVIGTAKLGGTATTSGYIEFERTGQAFRDGYLGYGTTNNGGLDLVSEVAFKPLNLNTNSGNIILGPGNGNVGIGTSTPTQKLTIAGIGNVLGVDNTAALVGKNAAGIYETFLTPRWSDDVMYMDYGANGFNIRNNAMVSTMFMTNTGNVGIGTTPAAKLDVNGQVKISGGAPGAGKVLTSDATGLATWETAAAGADGDAWGVTGEDQASAIFRGGNVGIGTANPAAKLDVQGLGTGTTARFVSAGAAGEKTELIIGGGNPNWSQITYQNINNSDDARLSMGALGAEHLTIDVAGSGYGNVGIGTITPTTKLEVAGNGLSLVPSNSGNTTTGYAPLLLKNTARNTVFKIQQEFGTDDNSVFFLTDNADNGATESVRMAIRRSNGNVGIGTTAPTSKFQVSGSIATAINNSAANVTLSDAHNTLTVDLTAGNVTVTLPAANTCGGRIYHIVRTDGTTNVLTFSAAISLGNTTFTTSNIPGATFIIQSDGTNWRLINN